MTSERENFQCRNIRDDSGPKRVEMYVGDQLFEISVLLTKDRFIAVSKKMSVSAMPSVELDCIAGQKSAHNRCDRNGSSTKKQLHVIGHQRPRVTGRNHLLKQSGEPFKKIPLYSIPRMRIWCRAPRASMRA